MGKKHKRIKRETLISYLMIAPEMILMLIFIFIPIVYAFYISLFDWNAMGTKTFVGISNYLKMMQDLNIKTLLVFTITFRLHFFERRTDFGFHFIEQSRAKSIA